jgi:hypothetical protein
MNRKIYFFASLLSVVALGSCGNLRCCLLNQVLNLRIFSVYDTNDILGNEGRGGQLNSILKTGMATLDCTHRQRQEKKL